MTILESARSYVQRGLFVVPVPFREKGPKIKGWQNLRLGEEDLKRYFSGEQNIGLILGTPYNLTDVDLDASEALWTWPEFGPETGMVWGHKSKPASHHIFRTDPEVRMLQFRDPTVTGEGKAEEKAMLLELRSYTEKGGIGLQTLCPPSIHPTGEPYRFVVNGEPANIDADELRRAAARAAACALLGRYAPAPKAGRHDFFLALAGALAHAEWALADAISVVRAIYRVLWGTAANITDAAKEVETSFRRYDDGHEVRGLPHLKTMLQPRVFTQVISWLGLGRPKEWTTNGRRAPELDEPLEEPRQRRKEKPPIVLPESLSVGALLDLQVLPPELLIEDLLPRRGAVMLQGPQKIGKTIFAAQMAIALATGQALLKSKILASGPVIIVEQDDPAGDASFKDIYIRAQVPREAPIHFHRKAPVCLSEAFIEWLEREIEKHQAIAVVLDSYTALRPSRKGGGDIVKDESVEITQLDMLAKRRNAMILLLHHESTTARAANGLDWDARGAGTYAITAASEGQISIARYRDLPLGSPERLVRVRGRHLADYEMTIRLDRDKRLYNYVTDGPAAPLYPLIAEILREIDQEQALFTAKEYQSAVGVSLATAYRQLALLVQAGVLWKGRGEDVGNYRCAPSIAKIKLV